MALTEKQQRFADNYIKNPDGAKAYRAAGYECKDDNTAYAAASRLLRNVKVIEYIEQQNMAIKSANIADITEVKEFWTNTLRNAEIDYKDRLKASEYIAKTNGAFIDKMEHSGKIEMPNITIGK